MNSRRVISRHRASHVPHRDHSTIFGSLLGAILVMASALLGVRCHAHLKRACATLHEGPGDYSITSSARARSVGGIVRPRALAVFRLIASEKALGCQKGISPGF